MKNLRKLMTLVLSFTMGSCQSGTNCSNERHNIGSMARPQTQQTKTQVKSRPKIFQKNQPKTAEIYNHNQPYSGFPEILKNADRFAEAKANRRAYERRMEEAREEEQAKK